MLFLPTSYQPYKAALLVIVVIAIFARVARGGSLSLHPTIVYMTLAFVVVGLLFTLIGTLNAAPGALQVSTVYVVWPLVYLVLIGGATSAGAVNALVRTAVISAVAVEVYSLSYILSSRGVVPQWMHVALDQGQDIGFYEGFTRYRLYSLTSLLFLLPFLIAILVAWPRERPTPAPRWLLWLAAVLGVVLVILSGRRALFVVTALAPLLSFTLRPRLVRRRLGSKVRPWVRSLSLAMVAIFVWRYVTQSFDLDLGVIRQYFASGFSADVATGSFVRFEQHQNLISGWRTSPLVGSGLGAVAPGAVRSVDSPWAYELSYVALLFHVGLLGLLAYVAGFAWILKSGLRIVREGGAFAPIMMATIVGSLCFLVANASNPYLEKFDYLWVIFLPVLIVNAWLLDGGLATGMPAAPLTAATDGRARQTSRPRGRS